VNVHPERFDRLARDARGSSEMANVDGKWETVVASPMGDQKGTLTLKSSGDTLDGT